MGAIKFDIGGYFVREINRMVYVSRIADEFENHIDSLDCWSGDKQLVEFRQQGLMFEARVIKTGTEVCIVSLYASTPQLDVLEELEEQLMYDLERRYAGYGEMQQEVIRQACEIRKDESFVKSCSCRWS